MPKKRGKGKKISQRNSRRNALAEFEKTIEKDVRETERWIIQRKKFFKKLIWLIALIILLMIFLSLLAGLK